MKDNIMKITDGLFHKVFDEVSAEYPDITADHWIVDIGAAKLADTPENFDVIVMPNLYGDILSDVAAQIAGSVGLAGSANIGAEVAMFEAIHGSAPRRANQNLANPSGLLLGSVMMLVHIGQPDIAERVHNAWLRTIEDGVHTYDIYDERVSKEKVGTREFADAVIARAGQRPETLKPVSYARSGEAFKAPALKARPLQKKDVVGADVFIEWTGGSPDDLGEAIAKLGDADIGLSMISNRGTLVWPEGHRETLCTDHWCLRFTASRGKAVGSDAILALLARITKAGYDLIKLETLCNFDGNPGYAVLKA
jgi:isocitrate dehydrogenase